MVALRKADFNACGWRGRLVCSWRWQGSVRYALRNRLERVQGPPFLSLFSWNVSGDQGALGLPNEYDVELSERYWPRLALIDAADKPETLRMLDGRGPFPKSERTIGKEAFAKIDSERVPDPMESQFQVVGVRLVDTDEKVTAKVADILPWLPEAIYRASYSGRRATPSQSMALTLTTSRPQFRGSTLLDEDDRVAVPRNGGGPATFDPNIPSYRFAQHVQREPGELVKLDKGIVGLRGPKYPDVIFATEEAFQAYATCADDVLLMCDVAYFDYADGEIRTYPLPFEAATDRVYLSALADPGSAESQKTPPIGIATKAVDNTPTPASGFSATLSRGPKVLEVEPGVMAVYVNGAEFPGSLYASGDGFEALGHCIKGRFAQNGCEVRFFDHRAAVIKPYAIRLSDALKLSTYVDLVEQPSLNP